MSADELTAGSMTANAGQTYTAEQVLAEIDRQKEQKKSPLRNLLILGISLVVFFQIGLIRNDPATVFLLIGVIFVHEAGHWIGMQLFGYQNVQMFFIPMFGAAVSGQSRNVPSYQKAIVCLLGPVPGVLLGLCFLVVYAITGAQMYFQITLMLVLINAFNLLPFFPLDGGRFMHEVVFCRNRYIEVCFRVIAALCIVGIAWLMQAWILLAFGALGLLTVPVSFKLAGITREIKELFPPEDGPTEEDAEENRKLMMQGIVHLIRERLGSRLELKNVAQYAQKVRDGIHVRPPGLGATLLLLAVYGASLLLSAGSIGGIALIKARKNPSGSQIVRFIKPDGSTGFKEYRKLAEGVTRETEIDPVQWLYHGPSRSYDQTRTISEGHWNSGKWDGEWKFYDDDGQLYSMTVFDKGRCVCIRRRDGNKWMERKPTDHEWQHRKDYTDHEHGEAVGPSPVADPNALEWEASCEK